MKLLSDLEAHQDWVVKRDHFVITWVVVLS